jgi:hypothetical protein
MVIFVPVPQNTVHDEFVREPCHKFHADVSGQCNQGVKKPGCHDCGVFVFLGVRIWVFWCFSVLEHSVNAVPENTKIRKYQNTKVRNTNVLRKFVVSPKKVESESLRSEILSTFASF